MPTTNPPVPPPRPPGTAARTATHPDDAAGIDAALAVAHDEPELTNRAVAWLLNVSSHRRTLGVFGRVGADIIRTGTGPELHLTEETVFRAGDVGFAVDCPLEAAIAWVERQSERRAEHGSTGTFKVESSDRAGVVTFARVVETTVIARQKSRPGVDGVGKSG